MDTAQTQTSTEPSTDGDEWYSVFESELMAEADHLIGESQAAMDIRSREPFITSYGASAIPERY